MKKIFYFIASAIVALGAVACQNDINEGVTPEQEGFSINVTIADQTRVALGNLDEETKQRKLTFTEGDVLVVREEFQKGTNYFFTYTKGEGDVYTFTCEQEGVNSLVGKTPYVFYLGGLHEQADDLKTYGAFCNTAAENISGIGMSANPTCYSGKFGDKDCTISLETLPVLKFTAQEAVTISSEDNASLFFVNNSWANTYTTTTIGEIYLPVISSGSDCTVTVTTESGFNKSFTETLDCGKIYNLGTIEKPAAPQPTTIYFYPHSDWTQAGATFVAQFGSEKINFTVDTSITDYQVYSLTYTGDAVSFSILRMSADGKTQWNKKSGLTVPTDDKNCFFSTGWDGSGASAGYWDTLPEVKTSSITITAYNYSDWTNAYVFAFGTPTAATAWPGTKLTTVSGKQMTATITVKHFADEQIKFVVNNGQGGNGNQTADSNGYDVASAITFYFTKTSVLNEAPAAQPNTKLYLKPSGSWKQGNERYAAYFFGDGDGWADMTDEDKDGIFEVAIPTNKNYTNVIFCRMNGSTTKNDWGNKWDQTADLALPYQGNNVYTISTWSWSSKK